MAAGFFMPTKSKIILFLVIFVALYYLPVIPVLYVPVVAPDVVPASQWAFEAPAVFMNAAEMVGANRQAFGMFEGASASFLNILYMLAIGYVLACILLYFFHKLR